MKVEVLTGLHAREILDSRGNPTIEVEAITSSGYIGRASVPSGASTGISEAVELRDGDMQRYGGKGVLRAVNNVNNLISKEIAGMDITDQVGIDRLMIELDGTSNKSKLGANAILGVSLAVAHAASLYLKVPLYRYIGGVNSRVLPIPMMNIVNGGSHSDAPIAFQEFMIRPIGASSFHEAVRWGSQIFWMLKSILKERGMSTAVGDEGGFAPLFASTEDALDTIVDAIKRSGFVAGRKEVGGQVSIALDCAASEFYKDGIYDYRIKEGNGAHALNNLQQIDYLASLVERYPIDSIEDGMDESDWDGWRMLTERLGKKCQLVGDDLFVTNVDFIQRGIDERCANSVLIKVNQIGTLTETMNAIDMAHRADYTTIISHRSGETEDTTIADISVAVNSGQIKTGSMSRTDRIAKYNQLLRIEEELGDEAIFGNRI